MTSATIGSTGDGAGSHADLEQLADLDAGRLDDAAAGRLEDHLAGCADCRSDRIDLAGLGSRLAALGATEPAMPPEVARRLDAALSASAPADPAPADPAPADPAPADPAPADPAAAYSAPAYSAPADPAPADPAPANAGPPAGTPTVAATASLLPAASRARRRWSTQVLQVAAALVVLLGLGGVGYGIVRSAGSSGDSAASTAGGDSAGRAEAPADSGTAAAGPTPVVRSGADYTAATLRSAIGVVTQVPTDKGVPELQADGGIPAPGPSRGSSGSASGSPPRGLAVSPPASGPADQLASPAAVAACLRRLDVPGAALGVDLATYRGEPAAVIVVPTPGDPTTLDIYAVAPGCPAGEFLAFTRVASP